MLVDGLITALEIAFAALLGWAVWYWFLATIPIVPRRTRMRERAKLIGDARDRRVSVGQP